MIYSIVFSNSTNAIGSDKNLMDARADQEQPLRANETLISANMDVELNSAGQLTFVMPPSHPYAAEIRPMETDIIVAEIDNVVWGGRVTEIKTDFLNRKTCYCEGPYAYFNDSIQPFARYYNLTTREYLQMLLDNHNAQVPERRRIYLADVSAAEDALHTGELNYESTMDLVQALQRDYDGYIYILMGATTARWELYYVTTRDFPATQPIAYGKNLLDLAQSSNLANICTAILPLGEDVELIVDARDDTGELLTDEEGNEYEEIITRPLNLAMIREEDVEPDEDGVVPIRYRLSNEVALDDLILSGPYADTYGRIIRAVTFPGCTELSDLQSKAVAWIQRQALGGLTISCNAADLRLLDPSLGPFYLGMSVACTSEPHGLSETLAIMKIETDITKVSKKVTVGRLPEKTLSDIAGRNGNRAEAKVEVRKVDSLDKLPADAAAQNVIWMIPEG